MEGLIFLLHIISIYNLIIGYLILINIITFVAFFMDKFKAKRQKWRIPEKSLFFLSIIGGSIGGMLSMLIFRHKTQKWKFRLGIPLILLVQLLLVSYLIK